MKFLAKNVPNSLRYSPFIESSKTWLIANYNFICGPVCLTYKCTIITTCYIVLITINWSSGETGIKIRRCLCSLIFWYTPKSQLILFFARRSLWESYSTQHSWKLSTNFLLSLLQDAALKCANIYLDETTNSSLVTELNTY